MNTDIQQAYSYFRRPSFKALHAIFIAAFLTIGSLLPVLSAAEETKQAPAGSLDYYLQLAEKGDAEAQFKAGEIYREGKAVTQNVEAASKWYLKAAQQGLAAAQYRLGEMYRDGQGVTKDPKEALKWFQKSADQGYQAAKDEVKKVGSAPVGGIQDLNKALDLIR